MATVIARNLLRWLSFFLVAVALVGCLGLIGVDQRIFAASGRAIMLLSAVPLLSVGAAFLILQLVLRPKISELLKNLLLAATFILWGIVQLMPQGALSHKLGDLVIALYVADLAWVILTTRSPQRVRQDS